MQLLRLALLVVLAVVVAIMQQGALLLRLDKVVLVVKEPLVGAEVAAEQALLVLMDHQLLVAMEAQVLHLAYLVCLQPTQVAEVAVDMAVPEGRQVLAVVAQVAMELDLMLIPDLMLLRILAAEAEAVDIKGQIL
jgi:hypothetical protein